MLIAGGCLQFPDLSIGTGCYNARATTAVVGEQRALPRRLEV